VNLLDNDHLQRLVDYSFGDHSGVLGGIPQAFMNKANEKNVEFYDKVMKHPTNHMSLFIDNIRLYSRPIAYSDWLHRKSVSPQDRVWLNHFVDEDLLKLCTHFPKMRFTIFTAFEDTPLDPFIEGRIPENVLSINAANAVHFGGKIIPFPHGIERKMHSGYNHHEILLTMIDDVTPATKTLYVNHRVDTGNRGSLNDMFSGKTWATVAPRADYQTYMNGIKQHKFVLCPSGNGVESARNWETLYLRRVPVFKENECLRFLFKDYPAIFVKEFEDVTEGLLLMCDHLYRQALTMDQSGLDLVNVYNERMKIGL